MRTWTICLLAVVGCSGADEVTPSSTCDGRDLTVRDASGNKTTVTCPLTCDVDHCTSASNIPAEVQRACTSEAPPFAASTGAALAANYDLNCNGCQAPILQPTRVEVGPIDLAVYCMSALTVAAGKTLPIADNLDAAIVFFVAGDVSIDGTIDLAGGANSFGAGGYGGTAAAPEGGAGRLGAGPCRGLGGATTSANLTTNIGAGGGGAGHFTLGADGGPARDVGLTMAIGGTGGVECKSETLQPLSGGSSGGGGGDGVCNGPLAATCGRPGGGGGGALHIIATGSVTIGATGIITVAGGTGAPTDVGDEGGGGGGGGAGGAILIEAAAITIAGMLDVTGGAGGTTGATPGGKGGTPTTAPLVGTNPLTQPEGGSGGGGAAGFVRLNSSTAATCPHAACATGSLLLPE
jgi:hypothetical protein